MTSLSILSVQRNMEYIVQSDFWSVDCAGAKCLLKLAYKPPPSARADEMANSSNCLGKQTSVTKNIKSL